MWLQLVESMFHHLRERLYSNNIRQLTIIIITVFTFFVARQNIFYYVILCHDDGNDRCTIESAYILMF